MSTSGTTGTTQIWYNFAAGDGKGDGNKEDKGAEAHRTSLYVDVFQSDTVDFAASGIANNSVIRLSTGIHDIVMEREKFLFSSDELASLQKINAMSYEARYLLIRLCLRKRGKWHSLSDLEQRYKIEIGGKDRISEVIDELCGIARESGAVNVKNEEPDVIDLTQDENEDSEPLPISRAVDHPASATRSTPQHGAGDEVYVLAEDDAHASLPELLGCLTHDELKGIGKQMKVTRIGQNRSSLTDAIICNASNQTTLAFPVLTLRNKVAKPRGRPMQQLALSFSKDTRVNKQTTVVRRLVSKSIGRCIRISTTILAIFDRLNIVFFRSTNHSSPLLLPALLTAFRKRRHVETHYARTIGVFPSRQALVDYEDALNLEARIDEALSGQTPAVAPLLSSPKKTQGKGKSKEKESPSSVSRRVEAAKSVRDIWADVYNRWKVLIACKGEERTPGLDRFDCGYVLTRIVSKGAEALGTLKEHDLEMEVLEALLAQTKWRRGHRGAWYDRLALVLMTHSEKTQATLEMAMNVVIDGLQDSLTHLIYRPRLERRLTRLEKRLNIPMSERHKCDGQLRKARDIYIEGVRVKSRASPVVLDKSGRMKGAAISLFIGRSQSETPFAIFKASNQSLVTEATGDIEQSLRPPKGKTLWFSKHEEEVSVEQFALEYYYGLGFKGFHSEGRVVSTIFGLLFWDVIFARVPGAFETPFQSAPLDIFEDAFYSARRESIHQRLAALENGEARNLLEQVLNRERPHRTSCIGVDWDFEPDDLLAIVDCLGGHALAIICRMICEKYGQWQGGVPDLLVWNIETRECRFVEVKSPNDRLQENQKVWIDVLIGSETIVDLCHVVEKGENGKTRKESRARSKMKDMGTSSDAESEEGVESELEDDVGQSQNVVKNQDCDSHDFVLPLATKRKMEDMSTIIPRKIRKSSRF